MAAVRSTIDADACRTCGACCGPPYVAATYVTLTPSDLAALRPGERRRFVRGRRIKALATAHGRDGVVCVALRGRVGCAVMCAIYERRPVACRRFEPGSRPCLRLRAYVGLDLA